MQQACCESGYFSFILMHMPSRQEYFTFLERVRVVWILLAISCLAETGIWQRGLSVKWVQEREVQNPYTLAVLSFHLWSEFWKFFVQLGTSVVIIREFFMCVCVCVCPYFSVFLFWTSHCVTCVGVYLCKILCGNPQLLNHSSSFWYKLSKQCLSQNDLPTCLGG